MAKIKLNYASAADITVKVLKDYRRNLKKELKAHRQGEWMHDADVMHASEAILAIETVLKDFA